MLRCALDVVDAKTNLVSRYVPAALGDELGRLLVDRRLGSRDLIHREVLKRPRRLNVGERLLQVLELQADLLARGLGVADGLDLEGLDGLDLAAHIVRGGLERREALLDLVDDGLVLEEAAVLRKVDGRGELLEQLDLAAGVLVARLEGLETGHRLAAQAERGGDLDPVELERRASLWTRKRQN